MKNNARIKYLLWIYIFSTACTKTVTPDIKEAGAELVIEGKITDGKPPYYIQLSKTSDINAGSRDSVQGSATVIITDKTSRLIDTLKKVSSLKYETRRIKGISGHSYTLNVTAHGETYSASSVMPKAVQCDSVTFGHFNDAGKNITYAIANFVDPPNVHNYYTFAEYINGIQLAVTIFVFDDRLSDGKKLSIPLITYDNYLHTNDAVTIAMSSVEKDVYNYFYALSLASDPQNVSPANPVSNIAGNILGYFSAETISEASANVP